MADRFKTCAVDGCKGDAHYSKKGARGYCSIHYQRLSRHGSPLAGNTGNGEAKRWLESHKDYDGSECLIWPYSRYANGAAQVNFRGVPGRASRAMCILAHGEPPFDDAQAAHSCGKDHEGCVNPNHLRWDTPKGNCADRVAHGTEVRGEHQGGAKLTRQDVLQIRGLDGKMLRREIADLFGVSRQNISDIVARRTWSWLD